MSISYSEARPATVRSFEAFWPFASVSKAIHRQPLVRDEKAQRHRRLSVSHGIYPSLLQIAGLDADIDCVEWVSPLMTLRERALYRLARRRHTISGGLGS